MQNNSHAYFHFKFHLQALPTILFPLIEALPKCSTFWTLCNPTPCSNHLNLNRAILPTPFFLERAYFCESGKIICLPKSYLYLPFFFFFFFDIFLFFFGKRRRRRAATARPSPSSRPRPPRPPAAHHPGLGPVGAPPVNPSLPALDPHLS